MTAPSTQSATTRSARMLSWLKSRRIDDWTYYFVMSVYYAIIFYGLWAVLW